MSAFGSANLCVDVLYEWSHMEMLHSSQDSFSFIGLSWHAWLSFQFLSVDGAGPLCPAPDVPERLRRALRVPPAQEVRDQAGPGPLQGRGLQHQEEVQEDRARADIKWEWEVLTKLDILRLI